MVPRSIGDLIWRLFESSGLISAYLLYRQLPHEASAEAGHGRTAVALQPVPARRLSGQAAWMARGNPDAPSA
ncbi:MAG: hypothetical protein HY660_04260 [Armatimonadetes bacterium]|nr:hypothetical protein [Armatimonadota bacterium]